jgi:IclR family pca regulon transcriptional regulator
MPANARLPSPADGFPIEPEDHIEGLARGLSVIEAFDAAHSRMGASEVAARTGLSRTAARRHLLTLCHHGYASTDGKLYWLTARVLRLGESFLDAARVPRLVQPAIEHLSARTSETVNVSVLEGHDVVYLDDGKLQRWIDEHVFTAFTSKTVTDPAVFLQHVRAARELGYWIIEEHLDPALLGVAMAVRDRRGVAVAAISMTLQMRAWSREQVIARLVPALSETAQSLRPLL